MKYLKYTIECRVENEAEAKEVMEHFRQESQTKGYTIGKMGYTHKEKKSKGEVIDQGELLTVTQVYDTFWD